MYMQWADIVSVWVLAGEVRVETSGYVMYRCPQPNLPYKRLTADVGNNDILCSCIITE